MTRAVRRLVWSGWGRLVQFAARAYVAGPELGDALREATSLARLGFSSTIGFWNREGDRPRQTADANLAALDELAQQNLDCYLSVKAPPLGFARDLLAEIVERARAGAISVHFDSLEPETVDPTFSLIAEARSHYPALGCTLPGRWRRSQRDTDRAIELGLAVRVVKGQWADPHDPEIDPRAGFLAVVDRLAGRAHRVAVATHDAALAREALDRLRAAGTPCEAELLLGLPARQPIRVARAAGVAVRFYVPYGHGFLPYCLSQARQNPRVFWWMLRDSLSGRTLRVPASVGSCRIECSR